MLLLFICYVCDFFRHWDLVYSRFFQRWAFLCFPGLFRFLLSFPFLLFMYLAFEMLILNMKVSHQVSYFSYCGAQIFEIYGLGKDVVDIAFCGSVSKVGGLTLDEVYVCKFFVWHLICSSCCLCSFWSFHIF